MPRYGRDPEAIRLGHAFREARETCAQTIAEVATALGVGRSTIVRWETGRRKIDRGSWRVGEALFAPHLPAIAEVCPDRAAFACRPTLAPGTTSAGTRSAA